MSSDLIALSALVEHLEPIGHIYGYNRVLNRNPALFSELAEGARNGLARRAGHGCHLLVSEKKRKANGSCVQLFANLVSQLEQQATEPSGNRFRERDAARILQCEAIFLTNALNGAHLRLFVIAKEAQKSLSLDWTKLGWSQRLRGYFIHPMRQRGVQTKHGAGSCHADNHLTIVHSTRRQFEIAAANQIETSRVFTLRE